MEYTDILELMAFGKVVQDSRHDTARSAGRGGHDDSAGGVLLAHGQGIGIDKASGLEGLLVAGCLNIIGRSFPGEVKRAGKHALMVDPPFHRCLHGLPDLLEIVPDVRPLTEVDIFPITSSFVLTPLLDLGESVHLIDFRGGQTVAGSALGQRSSAHTVGGPLVGLVPFRIE